YRVLRRRRPHRAWRRGRRGLGPGRPAGSSPRAAHDHRLAPVRARDRGRPHPLLLGGLALVRRACDSGGDDRARSRGNVLVRPDRLRTHARDPPCPAVVPARAWRERGTHRHLRALRPVPGAPPDGLCGQRKPRRARDGERRARALLLPRAQPPLLRAEVAGVILAGAEDLGGRMPKYLMLSQLSEQGLQTLRANPERVREANKDVEEIGVKVLHQWFVLGPHDFVNIVEAPDASAIAKVSVALGARGSVHTQSYDMLAVEDPRTLLAE